MGSKKIKKVTVEQFIREYLIDHIGKIKKEYPYEAFLLISCGIEFLGKCLKRQQMNKQDALNFDWHKTGTSKDDFRNVFNGKFVLLKKYSTIVDDLYDSLRCGLCHAYQVKPGLRISNGTEEILSGNDKVISIQNYYNAFQEVCDDILKGGDYLDKKFFEIEEKGNEAISGATATIIEK